MMILQLKKWIMKQTQMLQLRVPFLVRSMDFTLFPKNM